MSIRSWWSTCALLLAAAVTVSCGSRPTVSDEASPEVVSAFYVSLAALQTSQDVLARTELERVIQLVPAEPAAWANLGLLLLRQQQVDEAAVRLAKAYELAPQHAPIVRLLALAESRKGNLPESIRHWRRAMELDAADLKAPYALALELERQGGEGNEAEAQRLLESLAARSGNLAASIEAARIAAKRGDAAALRKALDVFAQGSSSWPADARARLQTARQAAVSNPAAAATPVIFLKNVMIREPEYRAALAAVSTPRSEVGEPLVRLVALKNPEPQPAPSDDRLAFAVEPQAAVSLLGADARAVWLTSDAAPTLIAVGPVDVRLATGVTLPFPAGPAAAASPGPDAIATADLNYDFRTDLVCAGPGGLRIFRQGDKGAFTDVTAAARIPADVAGAALHGVWAADTDTDGDLDLVVARQDGPPVVLRNNGDGTFASQAPFGSDARLRGFAWGDLDGDGAPDAALMDPQGALRVFLNLRGSKFRERPVPATFPRVVAIASAEMSGDGIVDVLGLTHGGVVRLSWHAQKSAFESANVAPLDPPAGLSVGTARLLVADLDNNAAGDLVAAGPSESRVTLAGPGGTFKPLASTLAVGVTATADLDGNGRLELIGRTPEGPRVVRTKLQKQYHWQIVRPKAATATGDQRINSFGIGGEIEVRTGLHAQKQVIASPSVHFGLGEATKAEVARISWPNGVLQSEFDLGADTVIAASQRLKGSCPWLFAWNGREMSFVTDFIWRSPLGLRINAQATADVLMTEDWVKLRGDQLVPRDGKYDLRITAELWETHFFDMVSLLVADHPEGTEVFVDERFAVPPPKLGLTVTSPVKEFAAVRDDGGRDVRGEVAARDDRHLDFAGRGRYQGVTREHYVELDLPDEAPRAGPLWLVAQGWVHPTDSSINVALGQGRHTPPSGLSLHVADAHGRFTPATAGLGFPAGKDKTILIDLAGVLPPRGARRIRLVTNLEIFWDRLGWAVGRPDATVEPRRIDLTSADLRFRGYSVTAQKDASTPERPRYVVDGVAPRWRDLEGFHTRFGDVRELLVKVDDRYVIMNAGDEMLLTFPEAPAPAPGMVREFVLVGDGWVKDGDYNTTASRTVLPLPTHRSAKYVEGTGRLEDDPVYRTFQADFERYHTRYVSPDAVRDALRVRIAGESRE
jgi:FG-GAP-like repeat/ASPIC and UnbV